MKSDAEIPKLNQRIKEIINFFTDGNVNKFAEKIGFSQQKINRLFLKDSRTKKFPSVPTDIIVKITEMFVNIDLDWLITGKGMMFRGQNPNKSEQLLGKINKTKNTNNDIKINDDKNDDIFETKPKVQKTSPFSGQNIEYDKPTVKGQSVAEPIPFYDVDFVAGQEIHTFDTQVTMPDDYYYISELNGCTAFRAYSDSMEKLIKNGATLFATNIENWFEHLEYGNIYGIVCNDGRKYLKYIRRAKEDVLKYLLRSENEDYDDFDIPKSEIRSIWLIHAWINRKA